MVSYVGLDWSGDPGDPLKPGSQSHLIFAAPVIERSHLPALHESLARVRRSLGLPANYCFHFSSSRPKIRDRFFSSVLDVNWEAYVTVVDKSAWTEQNRSATTGPERLIDEIALFLCKCPDHVCSKNILIIDESKTNQKFIRGARVAISQRLRSAGRQGFAKVKAVPDHRLDGEIVQLADMIAGRVGHGENISDIKRPLQERLTLIN